MHETLQVCWRMSAILSICLLIGCGRGDANLAPVTGSVIYKSKPVEGAVVLFSAAQSARPAMGTTDAEGKFWLSTFTHKDGASLGENVVTITKMKIDASEITDRLGEEIGSDPKALIARMADVQAKRAEAQTQKPGTDSAAQKKSTDQNSLNYLLPPKYASPKTSPLKAEVTKGGRNEFVFELSD
jgi:hypothetical protein